MACGALGTVGTQMKNNKILKITRKRTLVKTLIYRIWVIISSYIVIVLTGQTWTEALLPTIILNILWSISYYNYDRLWQKTKWGMEK